MQVKLKPSVHNKPTFEWCISSTTIDFMRVNRAAFTRDGSSSDCDRSAVSPLPPLKPKAQRKLKTKA